MNVRVIFYMLQKWYNAYTSFYCMSLYGISHASNNKKNSSEIILKTPLQ